MLVPAVALVLVSQSAVAAPTNPQVWAWDMTVPTCALKHQGSPREATITIERTPGNDQTELMITLPRDPSCEKVNSQTPPS
jgi:hypothetical protein